MSLTYWPNADYAPTKNSIKRLSTSTPFPTFEAALSKLNSWERDVRVLWAWIDVKEGRKKIEKVQLVKNTEGLWSGEPTSFSHSDTSPGEVRTVAAATTASPVTPEEVVATTPQTAGVGRAEKQTRHYSTATKLAMVERLKTEGIRRVSRETGISEPSLRAWRKQAEEGKLVADGSSQFSTEATQAPPHPPVEEAVDALQPSQVSTEASVDAPVQVTQPPVEEAVDAPEQPTQAPVEAVEEQRVKAVDAPVEEHTVDPSEAFNGIPVQLSLMGDNPVSIQHKKRAHYSLEVYS